MRDWGLWFGKESIWLPHVAIAESSMAVLKLLVKLHHQPSSKPSQKVSLDRVMRCAAYFGRLEMLKWLHQVLSNDPAWTYEWELMGTVIKNPDADAKLLEWLRVTCPLRSLLVHADIITTQFKSGNLDVLRFLHQHNYAFNEHAMDTAAAFGHLKVVRFLQELGTLTCTTKAMDGAAQNGSLAVVRFLHEHRSEGCSRRAPPRDQVYLQESLGRLHVYCKWTSQRQMDTWRLFSFCTSSAQKGVPVER